MVMGISPLPPLLPHPPHLIPNPQSPVPNPSSLIHEKSSSLGRAAKLLLGAERIKIMR
ncbi:hypothetical protein FDUTEX481_07738 [Tolypothrix sp. PCC 7601]|nr:hypothetical protein FDUTEX481_07738 [Tolypothrix sp. PCC 7601]